MTNSSSDFAEHADSVATLLIGFVGQAPDPRIVSLCNLLAGAGGMHISVEELAVAGGFLSRHQLYRHLRRRGFPPQSDLPPVPECYPLSRSPVTVEKASTRSPGDAVWIPQRYTDSATASRGAHGLS